MKLHSCQKQGSICNLVLASLIVAVCGLMGFAGCVSLTPASKESLLKSAGFRERTPTTEKQKAAYQALPAYHLHQLTLKERTVYAYKDEKAGVVYLGSQAEYAHYRQLAAKAKLKERQFTAAEIALDQRDMHEYNDWYLGRVQ
jgi:hypothetical protein